MHMGRNYPAPLHIRKMCRVETLQRAQRGHPVKKIHCQSGFMHGGTMDLRIAASEVVHKVNRVKLQNGRLLQFQTHLLRRCTRNPDHSRHNHLLHNRTFFVRDGEATIRTKAVTKVASNCVRA